MGILLDAGVSFTWAYSIAIGLVVTIIGYYFKRDAAAQEKRIDRIENEHEKDYLRLSGELKSLENAQGKTNESIHSVKETVLKEIHGISLSIERFRNENSKWCMVFVGWLGK